MFKSVSEFLKKELDGGGELQPISSVIESKYLDVLYLVKIVESTRFFFFKKVRYYPAMIKVAELLQCEDTVDFGGHTQQDIGAMKVREEGRGSVKVKAEVGPYIGNAGANFEAVRTKSTSEIELERVAVNLTKLDKSIRTSKVDMDHFLIKELNRNTKIKGLGVICEVIKAKNNLTLEQISKGGSGLNFSVLDNATVETGGKLDKEQNLRLAAGCVLGFKVHEFPLHEQGIACIQQAKMACDGVADLAVVRDFSSMKQQVTAEFKEFRNMDRDVKKIIWDPLSKTLKCPQALYALDCVLEQGCICTGSPSLLDVVPADVRKDAEDLLQMVGLDSVDSSDSSDLLKCLGLLVSALAMLNEGAVTLIVGLEGPDRHQMLELVEGLLEEVYSGEGGVPRWNEQFSENIVTVATQVLEFCGLKLDKDRLDPSLGTQGAPDMTLLALYITLQGLNMLMDS
ncbi:uncharacterized protein LOC118783242 [Megalops cyprinoides]|uniref:uncharacterized protein LOC118783242 n=1 Tax=Megalops cyprinoides TaxID=118141 RepID=UPI001864886A|nr:uncharacterized protein LOC118783242 [Megalops cyprinoides]